MSKIKWHSGPPPSIGWWPCSIEKSQKPMYLRWWNGEQWSFAAHIELGKNVAALAASQVSDIGFHIEWANRPNSWPARSRT